MTTYHQRILLLAGVLLLSFAPIIRAARFFIDPEKGDIDYDGSEAAPWSTLQEVLDGNKISTFKYGTKPAEYPGGELVAKNPDAPVKPGDTLLLKNGYHGAIYGVEYYNTDYITIMAVPGHLPEIAALELRSGCRWRVSGLTISPSLAPEYSRKTLVNFASHNHTGPSYDCIVEACTLYSVPYADNWTKEQWDTLACNGISFPGNRMVARGNILQNVNFGISVTGDSCVVEFNTVKNFSGDGMRGIGNYGIFQYNTVKNCYAVNGNHDDGFQSWSVGDDGVGTGVVFGIVLRGNTIINYEDPDQPFLGTLQGIGCFDGMFEDWVVENNVIRTDHWHGITLSGATNCRIVNNTVVDLNDTTPGPPWIRISNHKDGRKCTGCIIRNNLTTKINSTDTGVTADHNIIIDNYDDFFIDYAAGDLHLKPGCIAIDSGSDDLAPPVDRGGNIRPAGDRPDVGAFEYTGAGVVQPPRRHRSVAPFHYRRDNNGIRFTFTDVSPAILTICTLSGKVVTRIRPEGRREVVWKTCRPGICIITFVSGGHTYNELVTSVR